MHAPAETAGPTPPPQIQETYSPALPIGTVLNEYVIESVLGIGGYGITYLAHDNHLQLKVAIKEFFPATLAARNHSTGTVGIKSIECQNEFAWGKTRYTQEAQTLARFNHPNIVRVNRYFEANHTSYLVMDYEEGKSLEAILRDGEQWTQSQLLDLLLPLLEGLTEIHKFGFLHRDIKPDNIVLRSKDDTPVLLDFGAARATATDNMTAMVSPGYGPAEQYSSDNADQGPWTDLYALAAVAYRIVSGRIPIPAPNRIKKDTLIPAVFVGQNRYSKSLLSAIDKALSIDEAKRPQSAAVWAEMLIATNTIQAPQTPSPEAHKPASAPHSDSPIERPTQPILRIPDPPYISTPIETPQPITQDEPPQKPNLKAKPLPDPETYWEKNNITANRLGKWMAWTALAIVASFVVMLTTDKGYLRTAHFLYTTALKANNPEFTYSFICASYFQSEMTRIDLENDAQNDPWTTTIDIDSPAKATVTSTVNAVQTKQTWTKPTPTSLWCRDVLTDYNNKPKPAPIERPKTTKSPASRKRL